MSVYDLDKMEKKLRKELDDARFEHTLGVRYTAAALAMCYGEDVERAQTAGLLHDCAKCIPNSKKISLCEENGIEITEAERKTPHLLHAKLGAYLARERYGVKDREILSAIRFHTTGKPDMSPLEQIIFLADYIEPMRTKAKNLGRIRRLSFTDMDSACYLVLRDTLYYLRGNKADLDNHTVVAYNYYRNLMEDEEES